MIAYYTSFGIVFIYYFNCIIITFNNTLVKIKKVSFNCKLFFY